jgi:YmgG-like glycine-zipper protein/IPT/TIG domain-containing protein
MRREKKLMVFILLIMAGLFISCTSAPKVEKVEMEQKQIEPGRTVRLVGENFGKDLSKLEVKVDDETAEAKVIDDQHMEITVPDDVAEGLHKIIVENKETKAKSEPLEVQVAIPSPVITSIEPEKVRTGSVLRVNGKHFNSSAMVARLGDQNPSLANITATSAEVNIPEQMEPGTWDLVLTDPKTEKSSDPQKVQISRLIQIPAGTELKMKTSDEIGSKTNQPGDPVNLVLTAPLESNGIVIASAGNHAAGKVTFVDQPGKVKGKAAIGFTLKKIDLDNHDSVAVQTNDFSSQAPSGKKKDAKRILIGTGAGALIGAIAGGGKGAAIGAGVGAGAGTTLVLVTKGDHVVLPQDSKLVFVLQSPLAIELTQPMTSMAKIQN